MSLKSLKHYRSGDIIMTAKPVAYVVVDQMKTRLCDYCLAFKPSLMSCDDCQQMFYCNQICQQNDWSYHRLECHTLANSPHLKSSTKLMIRLWLMIDSNPSIALKSYSLPNGQYLSLNEMKVNANIDQNIVKLMDQLSEDLTIDSFESISIEDLSVLQFKALVETFTECDLKPDLQTLWRLFIRVWSNVLKIEVIESDSGDNAYGLYVETSSVGHSCEPNACYVSYGTHLQVRAISAIKPNETIAISYIDLANPKPIRRQLLKSYFFECFCAKCLQNTDSNVDYEAFRKLSADFCQSIASGIDVKNGRKEDLLSIADQLVPYYEAIYEDYYPELSLFLYKYLQIMLSNMNKSKVKISQQFLDFVLKNIRITHGIDHKIYRKIGVISNITLKDLETDSEWALKKIKQKPSSSLRSYFLKSVLIFLLSYIIYKNLYLFSILNSN